MKQSLGDLLNEQVLPRIFEELPIAFPEFGWRRTRHGWCASNSGFTRARFAARADRVVCHQPRGFLIHGGDSMHWLAYVNDGEFPRGPTWREAARKLFELARVPFPSAPEVASGATGDRRHLLEHLAEVTQAFLRYDEGRDARTYLEGRGFRGAGEFGFFPSKAKVQQALLERGIRLDSSPGVRLFDDERWEGRLVHPWRDRRGDAVSLWGRTLCGTSNPKYLVLRGPVPLAFGHDVALRAKPQPEGVVIVEGLMDVLLLRERGFPNVMALGRAHASAELFEALVGAGVEVVTLVFDNDEAAGPAGLRRATDTLLRMPRRPRVYVVDPRDLGVAKDPDQLVRDRGSETFREVLARRRSWVVWRGLQAIGSVGPASPEADRLEAAHALRAFAHSIAGMDLEVEELARQAASRLDLATLECSLKEPSRSDADVGMTYMPNALRTASIDM